MERIPGDRQALPAVSAEPLPAVVDNDRDATVQPREEDLGPHPSVCSPQGLDRSSDNGDQLIDLIRQRRRTRFLSPSDLLELAHDEACARLALPMLMNVLVYRSDAIAHLCLPAALFSRYQRRGIETITLLRLRINHPTLRRGLGTNTDLLEANKAIQTWDSLPVGELIWKHPGQP